MGFFSIEKAKLTPAQKEILEKYDQANLIETFPGDLTAFVDFKGGKRYQYINTGTPNKEISDHIRLVGGELLESLLIRDKLVTYYNFYFRGKELGLRYSYHSRFYYTFNAAKTRAFELGAEALIYYKQNGDRVSGVPVKSIEEKSSLTVVA